jgi:dipeptidyl aminopeptidase/acylaminoacyl peptidase
VRIWQLAVTSRAVRRLTDNPDPIQDMALSPDGRRALTRNTVSLSYGYDAKQPPNTFLVDLATGGRREVLRAPVDHDGRPFRVVPGAMAWAKDGSGAYIAYEFSSHPIYRSASVTLLGWYDPAADRFTRIDLAWPRALAGFVVAPDGIITMLQDGVRAKPAKFTKTAGGWQRAWLEGGDVGKTAGLAVSRDGKTVAYTRSTASTPPQPYVASLDGTMLGTGMRLAELNASFGKKPKVRAEVIRWAGARGDTVEGILYYPFDYVEGRRYPLIHSIHGGPAGADRDAWSQSWSAPVLLYLEKGAFALKTNYHGSCCYGLEWVESIGNGRYYELEVPDLEAGTDYLITRGLVHPDSIATAGWSNGAILSTALTVANPRRYRAAIVGAGDVEWISDWGNVDFGASFDNYYFGKSPIEDPQLYIDKSPYFRLPQVRTPTLLFTGTVDRNVPPSQSWSHFRALQQLGNVETRLVLFPGEPHGLGKLAHQRRKVAEEMRWLDRFLWGRPDTASIALADNSPLAGLLKLRDLKRDGRLLGERLAGVLAPELVRRDSLDVGRFEVTRAQWQAFDSAFTIETGTENYPVSGITFERAEQYARWLAGRTGRAYRLPTKPERDRLDGSGGNTLDHWAGYAVNPDDAEKLAVLIATLPGNAPLLREAGTSGDAAGDPAVYDVGGNVAEWVTGASGAGELAGGSADRPADKAAKPAQAGEAYRGLRLVAGR